jgi:UDP-4-amino-4,6-dideoxy-N-acetyl-beta-L-altrosamine N-acetyltransferase
MAVKLVNLTEVSADLVKELRNWRNSAEVIKYFILEYIDEDTHNNWIENRIKKGSDVAFIIYCDELPQGCVYIRNIDKKSKIAEYGIFLKPGHIDGRGLGTIATYKILEYAFETLALEKIYLEVLDYNDRAIALYKKFNFQFEGNLKKHIVKNGCRIDVLLMALFASDWNSIKKNIKIENE